MKEVIDKLKTLNDENGNQLKPEALAFHENQPWLCEIVFNSSNPDNPPIRITTNILRIQYGNEYEIWLRDPGVNRTLWPKDFLQEFLHRNAGANHLDIVKENPA